MPADTKKPSAYRERNSTADRALDILGLFSESRLSVTASDLATELGVARSTAYRYLQTLTASGFVEEDPAGGFRLGLRIFSLARLARRSYGLSEVAVPVLRRVALQTGETTLLTIRSGDRVVCLEKYDADFHRVQLTYDRGSALTLNAGASAWVLLAWQDEETVRSLLEGVTLPNPTDASVTDVEAILGRLAKIRQDGYVISFGELDPDAVGIAAPIRDDRGEVIAGFSVVAIARRVRGHEEALIAQVKAAADEVTERLVLSSQ
ncbi:IclR family transcriptional regulator [Microbacterium maritypicum]|uniref:IclR family transcriptional regulator n=1 Tax=Microbacterium maritypicum TaxID=33918 RepID=UPI0038125B4F